MLYVFTGPKLPMSLFRHAMVQLGNRQAIIGGFGNGDFQDKIHLFSCMNKNCSIHQLDQILSLPRYWFVAIPIPDTLSGCITGGKKFHKTYPVSLQLLTLSYVFSECQLADLVGDGYCHDWTNNRHCNFDGGDCCGPCVNREQCYECICKGGGVSTNAWVGDGFCQDLTNNEECDFDGGDCCGSCINKKYCNDCKCLEEQVGEVAHNNAFFANGMCQDELNNEQCNYDGFDCCELYGKNMEYCFQCDCKGI